MQPIENTSVFTNKADIYDSSRPDYPIEALECITAQCELKTGDVVADIGAGTGKFTRMLLERGYFVFAVEPNDDMRKILIEQLAHNSNLKVIASPAEATTLCEHSIKAITVAQAFHWFNRSACKTEFARIIKPNGKVCLIWNNRDKEDCFTKIHSELMLKYRVREAMNIKNFTDVYNSFFADYDVFRFKYNHSLDETSLLALTFSRSYSPDCNNPKYAKLKLATQNLFEKYQQNHIIKYCYNTELAIGSLES